jgi:hypothetical protein
MPVQWTCRSFGRPDSENLGSLIVPRCGTTFEGGWLPPPFCLFHQCRVAHPQQVQKTAVGAMELMQCHASGSPVLRPRWFQPRRGPDAAAQKG